MNLKHFLIVGILGVLTSPLTYAKSEPVAGVQDLNLTTSEIDNLKTKALGGNAIAALRLSNFYSMVNEDEISSLPWLEIAAIKGSKAAQYKLAYTYEHVEVFRNRRLARFWINEASRNHTVKTGGD